MTRDPNQQRLEPAGDLKDPRAVGTALLVEGQNLESYKCAGFSFSCPVPGSTRKGQDDRKDFLL